MPFDNAPGPVRGRAAAGQRNRLRASFGAFRAEILRKPASKPVLGPVSPSDSSWNRRVRCRPLAEERPMSRPRIEVDRHEVARATHLVQSDAANAGDLGVDARVVMAEEADLRPHAREQLVEALRLAHPACALAVSFEANAGRRVM